MERTGSGLSQNGGRGSEDGTWPRGGTGGREAALVASGGSRQEPWAGQASFLSSLRAQSRAGLADAGRGSVSRSGAGAQGCHHPVGVDSVEARAQAPLTLVRERLGDEELGGGVRPVWGT